MRRINYYCILAFTDINGYFSPLYQTKINMRYIILGTCLFVAAMTGCTNNEKSGSTAEIKDSTSRMEVLTPVPDSVMMKNWMAYATPADMHKLMSEWDGTWEGTVIAWHKPGMPADTSKSTSVNKMIMGGRYQQSSYSGNMMGMPFEGMSVMGYDNAKKVFFTNWIDNMGTGIMNSEGTWDPATKTLTTTGKMIDPSRGTAREMTARQEMKIIDPTHQTMDMYGPGDDGKEFHWMHIDLVKK